MATINWCKKQKKGIQLIEQNENLAREYIQTAEETLEILKSIQGKSRVWLATTKYYCEYFAIYALLMRLGIKCEIHDCTIRLCELLEKEDILPENYSKMLEDDKQLRIDNQYYLKNKEVPIDYDSLVDFVLTIKNLILKITVEQIERIREKIENGS